MFATVRHERGLITTLKTGHALAQHTGGDFWRALARYMLRNLAG